MKPIIGKTLLTKIPHEGAEITFQHPAYKGTCANVAEQIDKEGLLRPTSPETASLVYDAFQNSNGEYESEIIKILKNSWLWEFTINRYLPKSNEEINNGVIIHPAEFDENWQLISEKNDLVKRLQENDPLVKFVPFGYKIGEQKEFELMKNPYIIARYGEEGAQKIAEVASQYKNNPKIWGFDSVNEEKVRMSALDRNWDLDDRLNVYGDLWDVVDGGHSFGVCTDAPDKQ